MSKLVVSNHQVLCWEKFCELTDSQWEVIEEIVDNQRKVKHEKRVIFNALLWLLTTGSQWRNMESKYPPWQNRPSLKAVVSWYIIISGGGKTEALLSSYWIF